LGTLGLARTSAEPNVEPTAPCLVSILKILENSVRTTKNILIVREVFNFYDVLDFSCLIAAEPIFDGKDSQDQP
jgi:hypothetical protein